MEIEKDNAVLDFLNGIDEVPTEKEEQVENEEEAETTTDEEEQDEKPVPFHKDPKVQRYIEKQIEKSLKSKADTTHKEVDEDIELPPSFIELVGNDTPEKVRVLKDLSGYFKNLKGQAREEFMQELQEQEQKKLEEDAKAQEELDNYFDEIESTYDVDITSNTSSAKKTRADFLEFVRKIAPKNENGEVVAYPDLVASFEEFQTRKPSSSTSRAKELASRGMTRSTETTIPAPTGRTWKDVERHIASLKNN